MTEDKKFDAKTGKPWACPRRCPEEGLIGRSWVPHAPRGDFRHFDALNARVPLIAFSPRPLGQRGRICRSAALSICCGRSTLLHEHPGPPRRPRRNRPGIPDPQGLRGRPRHRNPINLSIGQPDFPVPDAVKQAAIRAISRI